MKSLVSTPRIVEVGLEKDLIQQGPADTPTFDARIQVEPTPDGFPGGFQFAVLIIEDGSEPALTEFTNLAERGADFAFVTQELLLEIAPPAGGR